MTPVSDTHEPDQPDTPDAPDRSAPGAGRLGQMSPALIATLITIPVMVLVGFITFAALRPDDATPVDGYAAPQSSSTQCSAFVAALPATFEGFGDKQIADDGRVTWSSDDGSSPITLRCGVDRPTELSPSSNLQVVNPVQWFITETDEVSGQAYVCVDHRPYVALWVPANAGNAPITDISAVIAKELESAPLDFG